MKSASTLLKLRPSVAYYAATKGYQIPPPNAIIYELARAQGVEHPILIPLDYARSTIGYQMKPFMSWVDELLNDTTESQS